MKTFCNAGRKLFVLLMSLVVLFSCSVFVYADAASEEARARDSLTVAVHSSMIGKSYEVEGGGSLDGGDLFVKNDSNGYDLDEAAFQSLTSSAQSDVVSAIASASNATIGTNGVTESTVQNWWKQLQTLDGVGTKFLNTILQNTKPDFVTANAIYQPFSGVVGTVLGLIAVLLMAFLGIVMVADIAYIALPPVRNLVADDNGDRSGHKIAKSKIFSHDAIYAVQCAENDTDGGSGGGKQALGIYLKRRIVMLIVLGICLMYLVQGQIYVFVGWVLDLLSGFLGF